MVKDIQIGDSISTRFAVISADLNTYSKGFKLDLQLGDKTGTLKAVLWDCVPDIRNKFSPGDIVDVTGLAGLYQNEIQLSVSSIEIAGDGTDPGMFIPASPHNNDQMWERLRAKIDSIENEHIKTLLDHFFKDERFIKSFRLAPGGKKWHHNFLGGLLQHTLYMVEIADYVAGIYPACDRDLLICGTLLHDIGKVHELGFDGKIDYTTRGRLEGHVAMGYHEVCSAVDGMEGFPEELAAEVKHLVLSHQGEKELGSPVVPMTLEAVILNLIDLLDSQVNAYLRIIDKEAGEGIAWSSYVKLRDRFFYFGEKYTGGSH